MPKLIKPSLSNSEIEYDEDIVFYPIDHKMIMTIAQLQGYNEALNKTFLLRVDSDGNLQVSSEGIASDTITPSVATVTATATVIVTSRADRRSLSLFNAGSTTVYIDTLATVATATGFPLIGGASYTVDNFIGEIYGITSSGSQVINVCEVH